MSAFLEFLSGNKRVVPGSDPGPTASLTPDVRLGDAPRAEAPVSASSDTVVLQPRDGAGHRAQVPMGAYAYAEGAREADGPSAARAAEGGDYNGQGEAVNAYSAYKPDDQRKEALNEAVMDALSEVMGQCQVGGAMTIDPEMAKGLIALMAEPAGLDPAECWALFNSPTAGGPHSGAPRPPAHCNAGEGGAPGGGGGAGGGARGALEPRKLFLPPPPTPPAASRVAKVVQLHYTWLDTHGGLYFMKCLLAVHETAEARAAQETLYRTLVAAAPLTVKMAKATVPPSKEALAQLLVSAIGAPHNALQMQSQFMTDMFTVYSQSLPAMLEAEGDLPDHRTVRNSLCARVLSFVLGTVQADPKLRSRFGRLTLHTEYIALYSADNAPGRQAAWLATAMLTELAPATTLETTVMFQSSAEEQAGDTLVTLVDRFAEATLNYSMQPEEAKNHLLLVLRKIDADEHATGNHHSPSGPFYTMLCDGEWSRLDVPGIRKKMRAMGNSGIFATPLRPVALPAPGRGGGPSARPGTAAFATVGQWGKPIIAYNLHKIVPAFFPNEAVPDPEVSQHAECPFCKFNGVTVLPYSDKGPPAKGYRFQHNCWRCRFIMPFLQKMRDENHPQFKPEFMEPIDSHPRFAKA